MKLPRVQSQKLKVWVDDREIVIDTPEMLSFACAGRTAVPLERINVFLESRLDALEEETRSIKKMEQEMIAVMSRVAGSELDIGNELRKIPANRFTKDHGWRSIFKALNNVESGGKNIDDMRRVAAVKYIQYLSNRQEIIKQLLVAKKRRSDTIEDRSAAARALGFQRLPKGESVLIGIEEGQHVELLLSKHKCKIVAGLRGLEFINETGISTSLGPERTAIGRDKANDIVIDPAQRDVSRIHLIVEKMGGHKLQLTDLSSHGTYILSKRGQAEKKHVAQG